MNDSNRTMFATGTTENRENAVHGTPGFPMRVYWNDFTTYVAGQIPWHWHEELEFCVVTQGEVAFSLPGAELVLSTGQGIFINANTLHHMKPQGEQEAYMFSVLVHPGLLGSDKGFLLSSRYVRPYVQDGGKTHYLFSPENLKEREILRLLDEIYKTYGEEAYAKEYRLHNLVCDIWFQVLQLAWNEEPVEKKVKDADSERLYQALNYVQKNYAQDITLEDICKAAAVGRSECCRLFKRNLQMSPISYLIMYRINMAAAQLESSRESITTIAMENGFTDDSYFCKLFKRYMLMTPLQYRNQRHVDVTEG